MSDATEHLLKGPALTAIEIRHLLAEGNAQDRLNEASRLVNEIRDFHFQAGVLNEILEAGGGSYRGCVEKDVASGLGNLLLRSKALPITIIDGGELGRTCFQADIAVISLSDLARLKVELAALRQHISDIEG